MTMKTLIFLALGAFSIFYLLVWRYAVRDGLKAGTPTPLQLGIGAITNFFDTLGIGSFATTTALFRINKLVADRLIPGTLNVGHTPATLAQAFIYIAIVEVDMTTLVSMIAAACLGAWLGAGIVSGWSAQKVRIGMGIALLVAASLFLMTQLGLMPKGGDTLGLTGVKLAIAVLGNFGLGALMSLGIGLYGPCMILIYLLGMVPTAAFPIMMGSCAFLMPTSTSRFVRAKSFDPQAALGLAFGGVPAVLIAAYIVKSMPLDYVRWLVIVVVVYTAVSMLWTAYLEKDQPAA